MRTWLIFLRPRQWPILTCQLAVGVLAAPAAVAGLRAGRAPDAAVLVAAWAAWVVALNGGTLAYNSAYDRDTDSVAYLRRPPPPPSGLARRALLLMTGGALLGAVVAPGFAAVTAVCVLLSLLYSHPAVRLKGVAGADLAVNMLGYGAGTTLAGFFAGQAAWGAAAAPPDGATWRLAAGFGLLFGSFYPLTQIYQIAPDRRRGDRTLAVRLGPRRAAAAGPGARRGRDARLPGRGVPLARRRRDRPPGALARVRHGALAVPPGSVARAGGSALRAAAGGGDVPRPGALGARRRDSAGAAISRRQRRRRGALDPRS